MTFSGVHPFLRSQRASEDTQQGEPVHVPRMQEDFPGFFFTNKFVWSLILQLLSSSRSQMDEMLLDQFQLGQFTSINIFGLRNSQEAVVMFGICSIL